MSRYEDFSVTQLRVGKILTNPLTSSTIEFGEDGTGVDVKFYGDTASIYTLWDYSADTWYFGQSGYGPDVYFYSGTAGDYAMWDASDKALEFIDCHISIGDSDELRFGDLAAGDVVAMWNGTKLTIVPAVTSTIDLGSATANANIQIDGTLTVGATGAGAGYDVVFNASDSSAEITIDVSANKAIFDGVDLQINDSDELRFGDLAAGDVVAIWNGTKFTVIPAVTSTFDFGSGTANANVQIDGTLIMGVDDTGYDAKLFGATAGAFMLWDESADSLELDKSTVRFKDSCTASGAFTFVNTATCFQTGTAATTVMGSVKVTVGSTTGYVAIYTAA